jgi:hypothetical protein
MHREFFSVLLFFTLFPLLLIQAGNRGRIKGKVTDLSIIKESHICLNNI